MVEVAFYRPSISLDGPWRITLALKLGHPDVDTLHRGLQPHGRTESYVDAFSLSKLAD